MKGRSWALSLGGRFRSVIRLMLFGGCLTWPFACQDDGCLRAKAADGGPTSMEQDGSFACPVTVDVGASCIIEGLKCRSSACDVASANCPLLVCRSGTWAEPPAPGDAGAGRSEAGASDAPLARADATTVPPADAGRSLADSGNAGPDASLTPLDANGHFDSGVSDVGYVAFDGGTPDSSSDPNACLEAATQYDMAVPHSLHDQRACGPDAGCEVFDPSFACADTTSSNTSCWVAITSGQADAAWEALAGSRRDFCEAVPYNCRARTSCRPAWPDCYEGHCWMKPDAG